MSDRLETTMFKTRRVLCVALAVIVCVARPASADWLLSGFVSPLFNVKTSATNDDDGFEIVPPENFDSSVGYGVNLASAFPARANLGFEIDFGFYPAAMKKGDQFGEDFASKLMTKAARSGFDPRAPNDRRRSCTISTHRAGS